LRARLETSPGKVLFVDFDERARYADAVAIMDVARGAGAAQVSLRVKPTSPPALH
jgi:biopolymer transport protein ExbD